MTIRKSNNKIRYLISIILVLLLMIPCINGVSAIGKEYKISFKVGSKGVYSDGATSKNIKVEANSNLSIAPDTLVAELEIEEGYYFNGWNYTVQQENITKSANYVAQYKRIVDEAVYEVSYVDTQGNQLATPKVVTSNVGIVVAENAINIEGYAVDQLTKTATVEKEGTKIVFTYVSTVGGNIETIVQNDVVVVAGTGGTTGLPGAGADGTTGGTTDTAEGATGNEAGGTGGIGTEEVPEDQTPLAGGEKDTKNSDSNSGMLIGGGIAGLAVIAAIAYYYTKKRRMISDD